MTHQFYFQKRSEIGLETKTCTRMFIAALFSIPKHEITPNAHQLMDTQKVDNTSVEYHSAIKKKVVVHATTWMGIKTLSERSHTFQISYCMFPFIRDTQNRQIHKQKAD